MLLLSPARTIEPAEQICEWRWRYQDEQGALTSGEIDAGALSDFVENHSYWFERPDRVALVLPSTDVMSLSVSVPGRTASSIRQALPFALEEFITSDVEDVHIAHQPIRPGQPVDCAVIDADRLRSWLAQVLDAGARVGSAFSQAEVLRPQDISNTVLLFEQDQVLVVTSDQDALIDRDGVPNALDALGADTITSIGGELSDLELGQISSAPEQTIVQSPPLDYLAQRLSDKFTGLNTRAGPLNLLQGDFAVRFEDKGVSVKWRRTLALACVWVAIAIVGLAAQGLWFEHQADARTAENFMAFESMFPGDSVPITTTQLQRRLASKISVPEGAERSMSMVDLMLRTTSVLGPNSELQALRFRAKQMELTADVLISGFDELDAIKNRSQAAGIVVEVSDATAERNHVRARLKGTYL